MDGFEEFEIFGGYNYNQEKGNFTGNLRLYEDSKLVGTMDDKGTDIVLNKKEKKVILGIGNKNAFVFLKLSSLDKIAPIMYVLRSYEGERYEGKWTPIKGISIDSLINDSGKNKGFRELRQAFDSTSLQETLDALGKIELDRIGSYFDEGVVKRIFLKSNFTGYLTKTKVSSFSV